MVKRSFTISRIATGLSKLFGGEAGAGALLILVAAAAMVAANSPLAHGYPNLFHCLLGGARLPS